MIQNVLNTLIFLHLLDLNVPAEALRTRPPGSFYHNPMMPIREADGKWFMLTGERVDIRNRAEGTY